MRIKRITVIVPRILLPGLEDCLRVAGVPGMSIDNVRGFGEHANYFSQDLLMANTRVEVYVGEDRYEKLIEAILKFSSKNHMSAGILTVENVERMINLSNGESLRAEDV